MENLESKFKCAGFCEREDHFAFTDVNRGIPENSCLHDLHEYTCKELENDWGRG